MSKTTAGISEKDGHGGVLFWESHDGAASGVILPEAFPGVLAVLLEDALKGTRVLKRNSLIVDEKGFVGEWVAIPREDFDRLWELLPIPTEPALTEHDFAETMLPPVWPGVPEDGEK